MAKKKAKKSKSARKGKKKVKAPVKLGPGLLKESRLGKFKFFQIKGLKNLILVAPKGKAKKTKK